MAGTPDAKRLRRLRLAAQRLGSPAAEVREATRAVVGIQAQDVRAAGLALRSRVPGLRRSEVDASPLVRTWTVRGTVHLHDPDDLPWLDAVLGPRLRARWTAELDRRGGLAVVTAMRDDLVEVLAPAPLSRAALLAALGRPALPPPAVNVLMPWASAHGLVVGLPDGRYRTADPLPGVDPEEAMATLARRYLAGYGPASAADLARWSGLPLTTARRALAALGELDRAGELVALPGTLDADPPPTPPALLLAAFDTAMLGYRSREPLIAAHHDQHVQRGGGMVRPVVLVDGVAAGIWTHPGSAVSVTWFDGERPSPALDAEIADVHRHLA